jgi:hypothetical protein
MITLYSRQVVSVAATSRLRGEGVWFCSPKAGGLSPQIRVGASAEGPSVVGDIRDTLRRWSATRSVCCLREAFLLVQIGCGNSKILVEATAAAWTLA